MVVDIYDVLKSWGLSENPFSRYVAESEPRLGEYFVPPPYLDQILGSARDTSSFILFGPRGSGKSAIRVVVEQYCRDPSRAERLGGRVLAVTYDDFGEVLASGLSSVELGHHIRAVLRLLVAGALQALVDRCAKEPAFLEKYPDEELEVLKWFVKVYYLDLPEAHREHSVRSVSQILDSKLLKAGHDFQKFWSEIKRPIAEIAAWIAAARGGDQDAKSLRLAREEADLPTLQTLEKFRFAILPLDFDAIYVLVDKLDEDPRTDRDAENTARLLHPLLANTKLIELVGYSFKVFAWDQVRAHLAGETYRIRLDKYRNELLSWDGDAVLEMLNERLKAFSSGRVTSLRDLAAEETEDDLLDAVKDFSGSIPREAVQLMDAVLREHCRLASGPEERIRLEALRSGLAAYSIRRLQDMYEQRLISEVAGRLRLDVFTNRDVQTAFSIGAQGARNKIQGWINTGAVKQTGTRVVEDANRPLHEFSVVDPRLRYVIDQGLEGSFDFIPT